MSTMRVFVSAAHSYAGSAVVAGARAAYPDAEIVGTTGDGAVGHGLSDVGGATACAGGGAVSACRRRRVARRPRRWGARTLRHWRSLRTSSSSRCWRAAGATRRRLWGRCGARRVTRSRAGRSLASPPPWRGAARVRAASFANALFVCGSVRARATAPCPPPVHRVGRHCGLRAAVACGRTLICCCGAGRGTALSEGSWRARVVPPAWAATAAAEASLLTAATRAGAARAVIVSAGGVLCVLRRPRMHIANAHCICICVCAAAVSAQHALCTRAHA